MCEKSIRKRVQWIAWGAVIASPKLLVPQCSPQVPACDRSERSPSLTEAVHTMVVSVDVCDGPFESDVAQGEHIRITKYHDAKYCERPRSNALDSSEGILPSSPRPNVCPNFFRFLQNADAALGAAFGKAECAQTLQIRRCMGRCGCEIGIVGLQPFRYSTSDAGGNLLSHYYSEEAPDGIFGRMTRPPGRLICDYLR